MVPLSVLFLACSGGAGSATGGKADGGGDDPGDVPSDTDGGLADGGTPATPKKACEDLIKCVPADDHDRERWRCR